MSWRPSFKSASEPNFGRHQRFTSDDDAFSPALFQSVSSVSEATRSKNLSLRHFQTTDINNEKVVAASTADEAAELFEGTAFEDEGSDRTRFGYIRARKNRIETLDDKKMMTPSEFVRDRLGIKSKANSHLFIRNDKRTPISLDQLFRETVSRIQPPELPDAVRFHRDMLDRILGRRNRTLVLYRVCRLDEKFSTLATMEEIEASARIDEQSMIEGVVNHVQCGSRMRSDRIRTYISTSRETQSILWWSHFGFRPVKRIEIQFPNSISGAESPPLWVWDVSNILFKTIFEELNRKSALHFASSSTEVILLQQESNLNRDGWRVSVRSDNVVQQECFKRYLSPSADHKSFPKMMGVFDLEPVETMSDSSSGALLVRNKNTGKKYVLKRARGVKDANRCDERSLTQTIHEFTASCVYQLYGVPTPPCALYDIRVSIDGHTPLDGYILLTEYVEHDEYEFKRLFNEHKLASNMTKKFSLPGQALDILLSHEDVAGPDYRNLIYNNKEIYRIDFDKTLIFMNYVRPPMVNKKLLDTFLGTDVPSRNTDAESCRRRMYALKKLKDIEREMKKLIGIGRELSVFFKKLSLEGLAFQICFNVCVELDARLKDVVDLIGGDTESTPTSLVDPLLRLNISN